MLIAPKPAAHIDAGAGLAATPVVETVRSVLDAAGLAVRVFSGVHPNPTTDDLAAGAALLADSGVAGENVALVAVGGGSPIDAAKGIAVAAVNPHRGRELDYRTEFAVPAPTASSMSGTPARCRPPRYSTRSSP